MMKEIFEPPKSKENYIKRRKDNFIQIKSYNDFLQSEKLTFPERIKLINEIARLSEQNKNIDGMSLRDAKCDDNSWKLEVFSKINNYNFDKRKAKKQEVFY